jgi:hypothetical protein
MSMHRIPLEVLRIEQPCPADWSAMAGDDRRRFCRGCEKHVHNLSALSRDEADRLICESAGSLCLRMERAPDGTVATIDYQGSTRTRPRRGWRFWTGVGMVGGLVAGLVQACTGRSPTAALTPAGPPPPTTMPVMATMGVICNVPPNLPAAYPSATGGGSPDADRAPATPPGDAATDKAADGATGTK